MLPTSIITRSRKVASRFVGDDGGNIAVIFALTLLPILGFIGAAIDYSRASRARTAMQAALDSTALMVSKDLGSDKIKASEVSEKAQTYFNSLYTGTEARGVTLTTNYTAKDDSGSSTVVVNGDGAVSTHFMKMFGFPSLAIGSAATATWGGTRLRVAMALDVTGSMVLNGSTKLAEMKKAASALVDTLRASAQSKDDLYISVVPFAQMVNVGSSNIDASWIKWDVWDETEGSCSKSKFKTKTDCEDNGRTWTATDRSKWKGCVTDRDQPADTTKDAPTSDDTRFPALRTLLGTTSCPAQIFPMTSAYAATDAQKIKDVINDLVADGGTNQPIGMAWAWMSLQQGNPLNTPAKDPNYKYTDAIILLSDGLNTMDRWPDYGDGQRQFDGKIDARQKLLCDNIKLPDSNGKRPVVYTIQVNTTGDPESTILRYCADGGNFFATTTASGIGTAFAQIGSSLSKLRIAK
ncbi:TadE/TadG family type IV pilus assembly protein [Rhodopseudomonas pseudopalustris]|uniref:Flp pilus assembly protein TadG n=1 Tax=Rhodopseudomonas pseudopalustris TaxID=1513892 RepID=A0A1H8V3L4_9BRAD|nr:TadE/TadG family type IV pilus assembly protein [Rhodopseudomonas pseudopalustris]SEP10082.1 Flp pilus assembly protein TadG [Rhodopseudomonas pseudopalustris]